MDDLEAFARLVTALRPWLSQLVVVGGWAHRLHHFHPLATPPSHLPLRTRDADLAFARDAALDGDLSTALKSAGFAEELYGEHSPPFSFYSLGADDSGFFAEFLTPLTGSSRRRDGSSDAALLKAGVTAQKLRHLELLLESPWTVRVGPANGLPIEGELNLLVPNATSFVVQKLLMHGERPSDKKAQDILYIADTIELFGPSLRELRDLWARAVGPAMPERAARRVRKLAKDLFLEVTDDIRQAARIPQDRALSPQDIREVCEYGLSEILGVSESGPFSG